MSVDRLRSQLADTRLFWLTSIVLLAQYVIMQRSPKLFDALDSGVDNWLHAMIADSEAVRIFAREGLAFFGHSELSTALGIIMFVSLWSRRYRFEGVLCLFTLATSWVIVRMLKINLERQRPEYALDFMDSFAWPSGHVAISVVLLGLVLLVWLPKLADGSDTSAAHIASRLTGAKMASGLLIGIPIITAVGRIVGGVHWFSDTVAGLLTGLALLSASLWLHEHIPAANPQIAADESE